MKEGNRMPPQDQEEAAAVVAAADKKKRHEVVPLPNLNHPCDYLITRVIPHHPCDAYILYTV